METVFNTETGKTERVYKRDKSIPKRKPVDEETLNNLRENQFRKRGAGFVKAVYGFTGDEKEKVLFLQDRIRAKLRNLDKAEQSSKNLLLSLGQDALELQKVILQFNNGRRKDKKVSVKFIFNEAFGARANRVYEAVAIARAISAGMKKDTQTTTLMRVGEKLGNPKTAELMETVISEDSIPFAGKIERFSELSQNEKLQALRQLSPKGQKKLNRVKALRQLCEQLENTAKNAAYLYGNYRWIGSKKKNQIRIRISEIGDQISAIHKTLEAIEKDISVES